MSDWTARIPLKVPCLQTTDAGQHTQTRIACAHRYYYTLFSYLYVFYMIYLLYIAYNVYIYIYLIVLKLGGLTMDITRFFAYFDKHGLECLRYIDRCCLSRKVAQTCVWPFSSLLKDTYRSLNIQRLSSLTPWTAGKKGEMTVFLHILVDVHERERFTRWILEMA